MNAEMETTIVIVWLAGVVCGTAFFIGLGTFLWCWRKKYYRRLPASFLAIVLGFAGMSNSIFTILRLIRSWL